jgi:hypothetical protein
MFVEITPDQRRTVINLVRKFGKNAGYINVLHKVCFARRFDVSNPEFADKRTASNPLKSAALIFGVRSSLWTLTCLKTVVATPGCLSR